MSPDTGSIRQIVNLPKLHPDAIGAYINKRYFTREEYERLYTESKESVSQWSREWPTESGWYWFYGVLSKSADTPRLKPVQVRRTGNGHMFYVIAGGFAYQQEGARGYWLPAVVPDLPEWKDEP